MALFSLGKGILNLQFINVQNMGLVLETSNPFQVSMASILASTQFNEQNGLKLSKGILAFS